MHLGRICSFPLESITKLPAILTVFTNFVPPAIEDTHIENLLGQLSCHWSQMLRVGVWGY